jgi:hypothetical protein
LGGPPTDFFFTHFDVPVIHKRAIEALRQLCPSDFQAIDIILADNVFDYAILNVMTLIDCIDKRQSRFSYWTEEDGVPEKIGQFSSMDHLVIDPMVVGSHDCFRPIGWEVAMLVSERVKATFEQLGIRGASFYPV